MNLHYLMHVPFEGLGSMEPWFIAHGFHVTRTRLYAGERLPDPACPDWLVVMGGPMSVHDEALHPWLAGEKRFIEKVVANGVPVLGVCLGGQLLASVLGAAVRRNPEREIGWFPLVRGEEGRDAPVFAGFPERFTAFHWHGETFDIPARARRAFGSEACDNQGFVYGDCVVGLQCHFETLPSGAADLCAHCADELAGGGAWVQPESAILRAGAPFAEIHRHSDRLLTGMARAAGLPCL